MARPMAEVRKIESGYSVAILSLNTEPKNFKSLEFLAKMLKASQIQKSKIAFSELNEEEKRKFWQAYNNYKPL